MSSAKSLSTDTHPAALADATQVDFDLDFFGQLLDRLPEYVDVLRLQAPLLAQRGRRVEALPLLRRLVALLPQDAIAHYNLACTLSVLGQCSESLVVLGRAMQLGYQDFVHLEFDPDLDNLRRLSGYREMLASYGVTCEF